MAVKNKLRDIRFEHKMNQIEFATFLELSQYQYNRYENQARQPILEIALQISEKTGRTVNEIFYLEK